MWTKGFWALAVQWCVLHPATAESGVAAWGDAGLPGTTDCEESLGGDGFYDLVCDHAAHLADLGDPDDLGTHKARALGVVADSQGVLDLPLTTAGAVPDQALP